MRLPLILLITALTMHTTAHSQPATTPASFRVATYNVALHGDKPGALIERLQNDDHNARKIAAILQRVRPDIVLLNEFDYDDAHQAADLFQQHYLQEAESDAGGDQPITYPYRYLAPVNSGQASGLDIDGKDHIGTQGEAYAQDAWGYGQYPGQYGMLILSMYPINPAQVRSFQHFKWSQLPNAQRPILPNDRPFHTDAVWQQLRLSSKSHWDVPIQTPGGIIHILASHPTPPKFDGPEQRNVARNADEINFWREYISPIRKPWLCDDKQTCGGLDGNARFIILGDLNNDPADGAGQHEAIIELMAQPRILRFPTPRSEGGAEAASQNYQNGILNRGSPAHATANFGNTIGTLRVDYILPSFGYSLIDSGVYWPLQEDPRTILTEASDHHLVWMDLAY